MRNLEHQLGYLDLDMRRKLIDRSRVRSEDIKLPSVAGPLTLVVALAFALFAIGLWTKQTAGGIDWYDALTKAASFVLLGSGLATALMVRRQMVAQQKTNLQTRERETKEFHYNRVDAFYRYFSENTGKETQDQFEKFLADADLNCHFVDDGNAITDGPTLAAIVTKPEWDGAVRTYLDRHESLAAAVNSGFVDSEMAYCLQAGRIIRAVKVFRQLIAKYQTGNPKAYCELLQLDSNWQQERHQRDEETRAEREDEMKRAARSGQVRKRFD